MYCFNIILTERCNARCSHCYMGDSKNSLKSLTKQQIHKIIKKLPEETEKIVFTGGEIFIEKDLLMYAINEVNILKRSIEIELETNGIYFYKDNTLKKMLEFNHKISAIRFSDDPFHKFGGIDLEKVRGLKRFQEQVDYQIKYLVQDKALNIGKANKLDSNFIKIGNCMNTIATKKRPYFFLDIEGNIYLCPWKLTPAIGNIYLEEMNSILKKLEEPFYEKILIGEIETDFSIKNKKLGEYKNYTKKFGQCMLCKKLHKENIEIEKKPQS